ncbi:hypothetical protein D0Y96_012600 [Acidipila sp. 4G-K13]|uniref:Uncharacterized protein n=2 Tax=Paracidobacterium acidisoli TaxID=2303751 RepID=A0A372IMS5_9BACT|nr:hypothetical protein [Paracidobacterium acidisoli]MBT9331886.1 hypothetical protein [Paracidobacterium acidisoli]
MTPQGFSAPSAPARLLGIPLGDFGFFRSLLLAAATGFLTFFAVCFLAIFGLLFYNILGHHQINYADSYRYVAFPAGVIVLFVSLIFFVGVWLRRRITAK